MDKVSLALQLILSLSILVVLHELGHYLPAKWFKTRVEKFYLFFDPYFSLFKKKIGDTEWGIGWIPFGGYVKISGMIDESMDKEQMKLPPQPWEFRSKKAWQRLIIMIGGVTVNFFLGLLIFAGMIYYWGETYIKPDDVKYGMVVDSLGMELGLQDGDKIVSAGGVPVVKFNAGVVAKEIIINEAKEIIVDRKGQQVTLNVPPTLVAELTKYENKGKSLFYPRIPMNIMEVSPDGPAEKSGLKQGMNIIAVNGKPIAFQHEFRKALQDFKGKNTDFTVITATSDTLTKQIAVSDEGKIGIAMEQLPLSSEKFGLLASISKGSKMGVNFLGDQLKAFGQMFSGKIKAKDSLGSVFSIASMFDTGWDWRVFWNITASLSILLAFFNLLPIPALDGGYVVFLLWEVITGRVPSDKFMEVVNYIGFFLLIGLMIFALGLDISRLF
ncbi:MAG: RIP metalloprotease RseP [Saprospiraceae bacterium]|nr:RIP metalloprotease RseP [Saprospiraceae bacterium]MBP6447668.1 RIP metalloprotease RseP [Saprospiraceae bacterium]